MANAIKLVVSRQDMTSRLKRLRDFKMFKTIFFIKLSCTLVWPLPAFMNAATCLLACLCQNSGALTKNRRAGCGSKCIMTDSRSLFRL